MAQVFLSCGQRSGERELADEIEQMIRTEFGMECYNANSVHGFDDVMSITEQLSKADYYLFIDFKRTPTADHPDPLPISVFTHQEFALARAWGITDIIAFQEEGLTSYGILSDVLAHPIKFQRADLVRKVREEVKARWNKAYSRNLVVSGISSPESLIDFADHTGRNLEKVWFLHVCNRRSDRSALNTVAILHSVRDEASGEESRPDSSYLKWAGQRGFQRAIFPQDEAHFDALAIRVGQPGVFLHSAADVRRKAIITEPGRYLLDFRIFAESFQPVRAAVSLDYTGPIGMVHEINVSNTSAELVE